MGSSNSQRKPKKAPPFPTDREVRQALMESGMGWLAVQRATSHALRLFRFDFCNRRRRRLYSLAVMRTGMVRLKEILGGIIARHQQQTGHPVSLDDLSHGNYQEMLVDYGPTAIDRALNELAREGFVTRDRRGIVDVLRPTGKRYRAVSLTNLRRVLDEMKLSLDIRYATEYSLGRTYRV